MAALSGAESIPDKPTVSAVYSLKQWPEGMDSDGKLGEHPAGGVRSLEEERENGYEEEENLSAHFFVYAVYGRNSCICSRKVDKGIAGI